MLAHNGTLKKLSLANNSFTDKSAPLLAESLEVFLLVFQIFSSQVYFCIFQDPFLRSFESFILLKVLMKNLLCCVNGKILSIVAYVGLQAYRSIFEWKSLW